MFWGWMGSSVSSKRSQLPRLHAQGYIAALARLGFLLERKIKSHPGNMRQVPLRKALASRLTKGCLCSGLSLPTHQDHRQWT